MHSIVEPLKKLLDMKNNFTLLECFIQQKNLVSHACIELFEMCKTFVSIVVKLIIFCNDFNNLQK